MAIVQNEANNYYKIILDESGVENGFIYVTVKGYATEQDRVKEKNRQLIFDTFNQNVANRIIELSKELETNYDENKADFLERLEQAVYLINQSSILVNDEQMQVLKIDDDVEKELLNLGLDKSFYLDPIKIIISARINCGLYHNEELNAQFYYEKLKNVIINTFDR